ncbi:hypothetical protein AB0R12_14435, partial [Streptomyces niveus]|uniref:hypothetical protein n=1 Tax=Streptomyces niveus TaxID=193462 RepID=UPI00346F3266
SGAPAQDAAPGQAGRYAGRVAAVDGHVNLRASYVVLPAPRRARRRQRSGRGEELGPGGVRSPRTAAPHRAG